VAISNDQFEQCAKTFASWIPMTSEHREALLSSEKLLINNMTVNGALLDKLALCKRRREAIESTGAHEEQVKTLIDIVSRQPDFVFAQLLNALNDTKQTEAADIIRGGTESAIEREASELPDTPTRDAWKEVDNKFELLLRSITKCDPHERSRLMFPLYGVFKALHELRKQNTVSTSRPTIEEAIAEEIERLLPATKFPSVRDPGEFVSILHVFTRHFTSFYASA